MSNIISDLLKSQVKYKRIELPEKAEEYRSGYIYIIYNPSYSLISKNIYKIGITNDPKTRLRALSTGHILNSSIVYISQLSINYRYCDSIIKHNLRKYKINREIYNIDLDIAIKEIENTVYKNNNPLYISLL
jgi:hypothetical protein